MINIKDLDKADVLAALYNRAKQQGMGFMHARGMRPMTVEEARSEFAVGDDLQKENPHLPHNQQGKREQYFDYLHGRVLKVKLGGDEFDEYLYDRDNGAGAAERAISTLRS